MELSPQQGLAFVYSLQNNSFDMFSNLVFILVVHSCFLVLVMKLRNLHLLAT